MDAKVEAQFVKTAREPVVDENGMTCSCREAVEVEERESEEGGGSIVL